MIEPLDLDAMLKHGGGASYTDVLVLVEAVRERDAEIARLRDVERRHLGWCDTCQVYHRVGNCDVTGEPPSKEAREGWRPQAAPPGADVMGRASRVWYTEIDGHPQSPGWTIIAYANALQQYGDERAAAAREAAIEEAAELADDQCVPIADVAAIRALAAKPGSQT